MKTIVIILITLMASIAGGSYYTANREAVASAPDTAPSPMPVQVIAVTSEPVQIWKNFSGHVVAVDRAEIRPQVSGRIDAIYFMDGQHVMAGDVLMVIDPRPYEAALSQAQAALQAAQAQVNLSEKEYQRAKSLIESDAISQGLLDERTNRRDAAVAALQGAQAAVMSAQINLDYAYVKAPISGKVGRAEITKGNLVQSGASAPLLTSVVNDQRVYVDFEVDERTYINSVKNGADNRTMAVRLITLDGGTEYSGGMHSFDNRIDASSGTIRARALFENTQNVLLPGMSVSVLIAGENNQKHILVSERAIGTDQDRKFVYVVDSEGMTAYREVKIGESVNGKRVIISGLDEGELVVTEGIVRIRPGMPVAPKIISGDALVPSLDEAEVGEQG